MPTRDLPDRPSLEQLKRRAKELQRAYAAGDRIALARVAAHRSDPADRLSLARAQHVIAREHGFDSWSALKHFIELQAGLTEARPHPRFDEALALLDDGDIDGLRAMLARDPTLAHARTNLDRKHGYFAGATLLHHCAGNPGRDHALPTNIVDIARALLEAGADVDAKTFHPNGGTTMGLLITSAQASRRGLSAPLIDLLLEHGARLDVGAPDALDPPLTNHAPRAAERMIELGAKPDVLAAAALGRMDLLRGAFDERGRLRSRPRRRGKTLSERDALGLALLYAYVRKQPEAFDLLFEKDANLDMTGVGNGTVMHRAAWDGDLAMVQRLVARGADIENRENSWVSTPFSWAVHNRQHAVIAWMRERCPIDLHDAVCMGLGEHIEARIREDPASVIRVRDQWEIPACTPLHWAAWPSYDDSQRTHTHDPAEREALVRTLLETGADPNVISGNGLTALDVAHSGGAGGIIGVLESHGARRATEL